MVRNLVGIIAGVFLNFALNQAGGRLGSLLIFGGSASKANINSLWRFAVLESFVVLPLVAVIVGAFVALIVRRRWWLAGVALLPVAIYSLIDRPASVRGRWLVFAAAVLLAYVALGAATGFLVSRFKRTQPV